MLQVNLDLTEQFLWHNQSHIVYSVQISVTFRSIPSDCRTAATTGFRTWAELLTEKPAGLYLTHRCCTISCKCECTHPADPNTFKGLFFFEPLQNESSVSLQHHSHAAASRLVCMQTEFLLHLTRKICSADSAEDGELEEEEGGRSERGLGCWQRWSIFGGDAKVMEQKSHRGACSAQDGGRNDLRFSLSAAEQCLFCFLFFFYLFFLHMKLQINTKIYCSYSRCEAK